VRIYLGEVIRIQGRTQWQGILLAVLDFSGAGNPPPFCLSRITPVEYSEGSLISYIKFCNILLSRHQNARQNHDINVGNKRFEKCGTVQLFGNDDNKSKPDSGGN
jgi:hypothetical protein